MPFLAFAPAYADLAEKLADADLAEKLADAVTLHSTPVGSGTVVSTERIPTCGPWAAVIALDAAQDDGLRPAVPVVEFSSAT